jgi:ABC-type transporter Mla MlaB component
MSEPVVLAAAGKPKRGKRRAELAGSRAESPQPLLLAAELGIDQAASLRTQLLQRLDDTQAVVLDGGEVQRVHTAAMQLFCLFCGDRRRAGREVHWQRPSTALRSAAELLGVSTLLQITRETA